MKFLYFLTLILVTSLVSAKDQDPYIIFINELREEFFKERKAKLDTKSIKFTSVPTQARLYLTYKSIEFYNFHDRLNQLKNNELAKFFRTLSEKDPVSLNNYYFEVIDKYINNVDLEPSEDAIRNLTTFTAHFTPQLSKHIPRYRNHDALIYLKKYKEDSFESNELTSLLQIIQYFGSFSVPFEEYLSEFNFDLNNDYKYVPFYNMMEVQNNVMNPPMRRLDSTFRSNRFIDLREPNKRKHFYSDTYNLITPELELIYTPIMATSILGNITTKKGRNFLHYVTTIKDSNILEQLLFIPNIPDFLGKTDNEGKNVILYAAENGSYKNMKVLIDQGYYSKHQDNEGNNILHLAIRNKDYRVILVILQNTPENILKELLSQKNNEGYEPINSFLSLVPQEELKEYKSYTNSTEPLTIPGSVNKVQHLLYFIPLLSKELELGIDNDHITFRDINSY